MSDLADAIHFIRETKAQNPAADKASVQREYLARFSPVQKRSLFLGTGYSIRFSETGGGAFSNTVLSLSALEKLDHRPMVACAVGPQDVRFLLANSTFLRKISHSARELRVDNVRGSFNGTDILTTYEGLPNTPENFEQLFAIHAAFTWTENLERLVESTTAIIPRLQRFAPTSAQRALILASPECAANAISLPRFREVEQELRAIVRQREPEILKLAALENVNLRGNRIEQLVTGGANQHDLGDLRRTLERCELGIDVKTKLAERASAPKAYNIDKMLGFLANEGAVFAFHVIGIDIRGGSVDSRLVPVLDKVLLAATRVQHHWAGRGSRGVTQLSGKFDRVLSRGFTPAINIAEAKAFLTDLLNR